MARILRPSLLSKLSKFLLRLQVLLAEANLGMLSVAWTSAICEATIVRNRVHTLWYRALARPLEARVRCKV